MKKIYFLSDLHLGSETISNNRAHEQHAVRFLDSIKHDAQAIYLLGDIFDFWYEYRRVVPKGYVRFLGKLAELVDSGIAIHFFTGNHDLWTFGYFEQEIGLVVHRRPEAIELYGKQFFLAHGDGFGNQKFGARMLSVLFHNSALKKLFTFFPPRLGIKLGMWWSKNNRLAKSSVDYSYRGENNEPLVLFAKKYATNHAIDFFVFGHRHIMLDMQLANRSRVLILGDWLSSFSYAVFDGKDIFLEEYPF